MKFTFRFTLFAMLFVLAAMLVAGTNVAAAAVASHQSVIPSHQSATASMPVPLCGPGIYCGPPPGPCPKLKAQVTGHFKTAVV
jgi:hypothetical protein